jgi:hypothetical protein
MISYSEITPEGVVIFLLFISEAKLIILEIYPEIEKNNRMYL